MLATPGPARPCLHTSPPAERPPPALFLCPSTAGGCPRRAGRTPDRRDRRSISSPPPPPRFFSAARMSWLIRGSPPDRRGLAAQRGPLWPPAPPFLHGHQFSQSRARREPSRESASCRRRTSWPLPQRGHALSMLAACCARITLASGLPLRGASPFTPAAASASALAPLLSASPIPSGRRSCPSVALSPGTPAAARSAAGARRLRALRSPGQLFLLACGGLALRLT